MKTKLIKILFVVTFATIINVGVIGHVYAASAGELINLTNSSRTQNSLNTLTENSKLNAAALAKANDMLANGYFAHISPQGKTPWDFMAAAGYNYEFAGENLAIGYTDSAELHNAWMNSPSHRENILNPNFQEIGLAAVDGLYQGTPTAVVVQMFGGQAQVEGAVSQPVATNSATPTDTNTDQPANTNQAKTFTIVKDKSGYNPAKVFVGDEVNFKVVITGEAEKIVVTIGNLTINLKDVEPKKEGDQLIYEKRVKMETDVDSEVKATVTDKWGNTEDLSMGQLVVAKKVITKASTGISVPWIKTVLDFMALNIGYIALLVFASGLVVGGGLLFQKYKQKLV